MKRSAILILLACISLSPARSVQGFTKRGDLEASTSATLTVMTEEDDTDVFLILPVRIGTFLTDRFEFEVEGLLSSAAGGTPGYLLSGLFSYHFHRTGRVRDLSEFLLFGLGVTNTRPVSTNVSFGGGGDIAAVLNLGAGAKLFLAEPVAIRLEYRFQRYMFEFYGRNNHMVLVGISYFVR
jgi:hypothetical protein